MNLNKKLALVENHQKNFVIIMLQAMNDDGEESRYIYSIICHEDDTRAFFNLEELIKSL